MMSIEIIAESVTALAEYADIPTVFEVREVFDVVAEAGGGVRLEARRLPASYVKDYDAIGDPPTRWAERFDLSTWGFLSAFSGAQCVGRAAVTRDTSTLDGLEDRRDAALLWDIRVAPRARRRGVGSALFDAAVIWASSRGCLQLWVETQNINVAACRFYAQRGCVLRAVHPGAYPGLPDEIQLLWCKDLTVSFDSQPILTGDLVALRPLRADDYDDLYAVAADPLIWEQHPDSHRHEAATFRAFFEEALASGGALTVIDVSSQRIIGSSRFHGYDQARSEVEIGWTFLARSHWGGRYNADMKRLMLQHAFRHVSSVIFLVGLQNIRSQRAVERIGGVRVGMRPNAIGRDSYVYQITAIGRVNQAGASRRDDSWRP